MNEKPVHSRLRRLVDWINLMGAKKVHSLIGKVYKRKNSSACLQQKGESGAVEVWMGKLWRLQRSWASSWIGCNGS